MASQSSTQLLKPSTGAGASISGSLALDLPNSDPASNRILYDVWLHKAGSHLEQKDGAKTATSGPTRSGGLAPSTALWGTVVNFMGGGATTTQERDMLHSLQQLEKSMPKSHLALSSDGAVLAQLHQSTLTIRGYQDEFSSTQWKFALEQDDTAPQRQRLCWNEEGTLLAVATSDMKLHIVSRAGKPLHHVDLKYYQGAETGGIVEVAWTKDSAIGTRASQLYVLTYAGILIRLLVYHQDAANSVILPLSHALELKDDPKRGPLSALFTILEYHSVVTSMDISPNGKHLAIGGHGRMVSRSRSADQGESNSRDHRESAQDDFHTPSISFWRILDGPPFFEYIPPVELGEIDQRQRATSTRNKRCCGRRQRGENKGAFTKPIQLVSALEFSPDSSHLLALDTTGTLTIWDVAKQLPARRYRSDGIWRLTNAQNVISAAAADRLVSSAHWWNNSSVFILHACGICSILGPVLPSLPNAVADKSTASNSTRSASLTSAKSASPPPAAASSQPSRTSSSTQLAIRAPKTAASPSSESQDDDSARNLLGKLPEKFAPHTIASRAYGDRIFIFESDSKPVNVPMKRLLYSGAGTSPGKKDIDPDLDIPYDYEMEGSAQPSCLKKAALSTWRWFTGHTDDKWGKTTITKTQVSHRLLSLRKTTPEALFLAKVASGEYPFALSMASQHHLNPDLVYQTQWRSQPVTNQSIESLLSRVSDRDWVLHECIERVPKTMESTLLLLKYGIQHATPSWLEAGSGNRPLSDAEADKTKTHLQSALKGSAERLSRRDIKTILQRLILLSHYDRLQTYALINENKHYDAREYLNFRTCSLLNACATFAQNEDTKALATLWTYHGAETLPYRLMILAYLPETLNPDSPAVQYLFPAVAEQLDASQPQKAIPWETQDWRHKDWSESKDWLRALGVAADDCEVCDLDGILQAYSRLLRDESGSNPHHLQIDNKTIVGSRAAMSKMPIEAQYKALIQQTHCEDIFSIAAELPEPLSLDKPLPADFSEPIRRPVTAKDLTKWYKYRAMDVERLSGQADIALALLQVGIKNGVPKLEKLHGKLNLLCSLVYECGKENIQLSGFEHMDDLRRLHFLLEDATPSTILDVLNERCEVYIHNAQQIWTQWEQNPETSPSFTTAYLTAWMTDVVKATSVSASVTPSLGHGMLPHLVKIFKESSKALAKHAEKSQAAPSAESSDQPPLAASPPPDSIIPSQCMLATLGLHILYLSSPSSKEVLDQLTQLYSCLPRRAGSSSMRSAHTSSLGPSKSLSSMPSEGSLSDGYVAPTEILTTIVSEHDMLMDPLYDRLELLGKHLKASEILLRHDLVKPMDMFLTTWRADEMASVRLLFERLVQRDIRVQPPLNNAQWRDTLKDLQDLRELLSSTKSLFQAAIGKGRTSLSSSSSTGLPLSGTSTPALTLESMPISSTPKRATGALSPLHISPLSTPLSATPNLGLSTSSSLHAPSRNASASTPARSRSSLGLPADLAYEVFCQALLRAGNFSLVKHYLYDLPKHENLVIAVAQEYFNSCSSAHDKDMDMARECLALIRSPSDQTQEEQKLIDAVVQMSKLENKFHLSIADALPIQVRRSHDRMAYLRQLIDSQPMDDTFGAVPTSTSPQNDIYTNLDELMNLGRLLGCASTDAERQEIKLLAANRAFKNRDHPVAAKYCLELITAPSSANNSVWDLAYRLALVEKVTIQDRIKLLAFAVRFAPEEALQPMITLWRGLELRANCDSMGVRVDMPRNMPTTLHLQEKVSSSATSGTTKQSAARQSSAEPSHVSLRLDTRKVQSINAIFINSCTAKLEGMNDSRWMNQAQTQAFDANSLPTSGLGLHSFYHPTPYTYPYDKPDITARVDPATGPLATFGDKRVEIDVLNRVKSYLLLSPSLPTARREMSLSQLSHLAINNGDAGLFLSYLFDPSVSVDASRQLFDEILNKSGSSLAPDVLQLARYYYATLINQLHAYITRKDLLSIAEESTFEESISSLVKRAEKLITTSPEDISKAHDPSVQSSWSTLAKTFEYFMQYALRETESSPSAVVPSAPLLELAKEFNPVSLKKALNRLDSQTQFDEFDLLEAHFVALVSGEPSAKAMRAFLDEHGDDMVRNYTIRFESTLEHLWNREGQVYRFPVLVLLINLKIACAQLHAAAVAAAPNIVKYEDYGKQDFVDRLTKQSKAIEELSRAMQAATAKSSRAPDLRWKCVLNGDVAETKRMIRSVLTIENVSVMAQVVQPLNRLLTVSLKVPETAASSDAPLLTSSLIYLSLIQAILKPFETGAKLKANELERELQWFRQTGVAKLDASDLHHFIAQYLSSTTLHPTVRSALCSLTLNYLTELLEGEEDETVHLLKRIEKHVEALLVISANWLSSPSITAAVNKERLNIYLHLLDATLNKDYQDSELAIICSRLIANGLPISMTIDVIEAFSLTSLVGNNPSITDVAKHVITDALKTVLGCLEVHPADAHLVVPLGVLEWPPSSPLVAEQMLKAILQTTSNSGTNIFFKDALQTLRNFIRYAASKPEPLRIKVLRVLHEYPTLYESRRDLQAQDDKLLEAHAIRSILADGASEVDDDVSAAASEPHSIEEKNSAVQKLLNNKRFEKAFQLLWLWSTKAQKEQDLLDSRNTASSPGSAADFFQHFQPEKLDESTGEGWGFDDVEPKSKAGKEKSGAAAPSSPAEFPFATGWRLLLDHTIANSDISLAITMRQQIHKCWISHAIDEEMIRAISAASPLSSWKYALCTADDQLLKSTVETMKSHFATSSSNTSRLTAFLRGLSGASQRRSLKYSEDYDAQLLYFMLRSGVFVDLSEDETMWSLLLQAVLFLHGKSDAPVEGSADYALVKESLFDADHNLLDASVSFPSLISSLIIQNRLTQAAVLTFNHLHVESSSVRTLERFLSMIPRILLQYVDYCQAMSESQPDEHARLQRSISSVLKSRPASTMTWAQCRDRCQEAINTFNKLRL